MSKSIFYIVGVLVALLMTVVSCQKEDVEVPIPEKCPNIGFDVVNINESFSSTTYSPVFYAHNSVTMQGKYKDYSGLGQNLGSVKTISASELPNPNANFVDKVLNIKDADVLFDYSAVDHSTRLKSIILKTDDLLHSGNLKINGGSPEEYMASQTFGEVKLLGEINTIELGGASISIDDLLLNDLSRNSTGWDASTFVFDNSLNIFIDSADTDYKLIHTMGIRILHQQHLPYPTNIDSVYFRAKYIGSTGAVGGGEKGLIAWGDSFPFDKERNSNFSGGLLKLLDCDLEIDFSSLRISKKHISFDVSNDMLLVAPNEFRVNGASLGTVPAGISYTIMPLGDAENGIPCYRVVIEGPINTIVLPENTTYDNLSVYGL
ncbi:hypothetical protein [Aureispira sp. CCB-E]|uniref:hypothetical protein n=1 Tax=Aureispira sp. CCB-E TaxID=3051121 RepID=UPI002868BB6A|nr:hypothetical protein [Aureispira sp. CCB-E]WMX15744.1 hypothetical protein QP953_05025 [Aureispira sp. CCB-E]